MNGVDVWCLVFGVGQSSYTARMEYIYQMQNMSFGDDGALEAACKAKHPTSPGLCFMSPHMQDAIQTPFFMFNSKYARSLAPFTVHW